MTVLAAPPARRPHGRDPARHLERGREGVLDRHGGAGRARPRDRAARVREPARPLGLRQEHGAPADRRPRAPEPRPHRAGRGCYVGRGRLRLPGSDAPALGHRVRQCLAAAPPEGPRPAGGRGRGHGGAGHRRPRAVRQGLPARALGRDADAGLDRPGAGHPAEAAADGRALRRPRRDHPLQAQQRPPGLVAEPELDRGLRHPQRLRVGLPLAAHRRHGRPAGPRGRRHRDPRPLPARRGVPHQRALQPPAAGRSRPSCTARSGRSRWPPAPTTRSSAP